MTEMLNTPDYYSPDGTTTTLTLDWIPPAAVRGNADNRWAKRSASKKLRQSAVDHVMLWLGRPEQPYHRKVLITYHFHHWRNIDIPNLVIGMKGFEDGLCIPKCQGCGKNCANEIGAGLLIDDDPDHVVYGAHTFTKTAHKGESRTIVTIEELE